MPDALAAVAAQHGETTPATAAAPVAQPSSNRSDEGSDSHLDEKSHAGAVAVDDTDDNEDDNALRPTRTDATDASVATNATGAQEPEKQSWRRRLNPLRWGGIPEIPKERIVSREYGANFFSKLFFNWMTPLMTVRSSPALSPYFATLETKTAGTVAGG